MQSSIKLFVLLFVCMVQNVHGQFFNQDFNISTTVGDYASGTPNIRQFDNITNGTNNAISISSNALRFQRTGAQTASSITRSTNIADKDGTAIATPMSSMMVRFTVVTSTLTGNALAPLAGTFQIGTGFTANTSLETTPYATFGIHFGSAANTFRINAGAAASASNLTPSTSQRITVALNNSGASLNYRAPDGTTEIVGNDKMDVWAWNGTIHTRIHDEIDAINPTQTITDFKFVFNPSANFTLDIDDISIFPLEVFPTNTYIVGTNTTVATATATFTSLTRNGGGFFEVLNFINNINGANTFNINSSIATENGANALLQLTGASNANLLTIRPSASGVFLTSSGNPAINFNGADYVTIDGGNNGTYTGTNRLTIRQTGNNVTCQIINDATNITLRDCLFTTNSTSTNGTVFVSTGTTTGNDNITINKCVFGQFGSPTAPINGGSTPTRALVINGSSTAIANDNLYITQNEFYNFFRASSGNGVVSANANNTNLYFENNSIYQTVNFQTNNGNEIYYDAVSLNSSGKIVVKNNYFGGQAPACGGSPFVMQQGTGKASRINAFIITRSGASADSVIVENNTVGNVNFNVILDNDVGTGGVLLTGISVNAGTAGIASVQNNIVGTNALPIQINLDDIGETTPAIGSGTTLPFTGIAFSGNGTGSVLRNNVVRNITAQYPNGSNRRTFTITGISLVPTTAGLVTQNNEVSNISSPTNTSKETFFVGMSHTTTSSVTISNNTIHTLTNNATASTAYLYGINQTGTANNIIQNNTIYNLACTAQQTNVSDNVMVAGIRINASPTSAFSLRGNTIHTIQSTATTSTTSAGILLTGGVKGHIRDNRIYNIRNTSASSLPIATGIAIRSIGDSLYIYNNRISLGLETNGTANTEQAIYIGIWNNFNDTDVLFVLFNSINIAGSASGGSLKTYCFLQGDNPSSALDASLINTPLQVYNNIFQNARTGGGDNIAIAIQDLATTVAPYCSDNVDDVSPDYNVYFASDVNKVGEAGGVAKNFGDWQLIYSPLKNVDKNSYNASGGTAITFTDVATADMHLTANDQRPDGKAMPVSTALGFPITIDFDIDGDFRRSTDAGADELEQTVTFVGTSPNDNWHDANNWQVQGSSPPRYVVPNCSDNVILPAGKSIKVYNGGTENPANLPALFYTLTIQNSATLELQNGTTTNSCWYNDELVTPIHKGEIKIETGGVLIANTSVINVSGRFTNSGTFTKGTSTVVMNHDRPEIANNCLEQYIESHNNTSALSNIDGASNTNFHHLTISNSGNTTIFNNLAANKQISVGDATTDLGDLDITGTGWLAINGNRLILEGDLTENTGSIAGSVTSDLEIKGTNALTGSIKLRANNGTDNQFENLRLNRNNKGLIKFSETNSINALIVNNQLDLTNGIAQMGTTNPLTDVLLDVTNNNPNTSTGSVINYLTSGGTSANAWVYGSIRRAINGTAGNAYAFPVGTATKYELIRTDITTNLGTTTQIIGFFNDFTAFPNNADSLNFPRPNLLEVGNNYDDVCPTGFWTLTPNTFSTGVYDIEIYPVGFTCAGVRPTLAKRPSTGGAWTFGGSTYVNANKRTGFTSFSDFAPIHTSVLLPLHLLSFEGKAQAGKGLLTWKTTNEVNTAHFNIERSANALQFTPIGRQDAKGNFTGLSAYQFIDIEPLQGINYYRLKQIDNNGKFAYSPIISLDFEGAGGMLLFPNPNHGQFNLQLSGIAKNTVCKLQITDALGRIVANESIVYIDEKPLPVVKTLPKGLYIVTVSTKEKIYKQKMIVL